MIVEIPPSAEPINARVTGPAAYQQESVVTTRSPRYSVIDHEANKVTVMSSLFGSSQVSAEIERDFLRLADRWRRETAYLSLASQQANDFDYHQIIGMGKEALPLIFRELQETTSDWFWALAAIARDEAPTIPTDAEGDVDRIAAILASWAT